MIFTPGAHGTTEPRAIESPAVVAAFGCGSTGGGGVGAARVAGEAALFVAEPGRCVREDPRVQHGEIR
jgi:hypothetical protein